MKNLDNNLNKSIKIKICGLYREEDIEYVNEAKPDYIGFVFYPKSHRYVDGDKAKILSQLVAKDIHIVGVFVNENIDYITDLYNKKIIHIAQLHGNEDDRYIADLKEKGIPVIKAFSIKTKEDVVMAQNSIADFILLDNIRFGSGEAFDWQLLEDIKRPYFLAGGLSCENLKDALKYQPYAVDVSSGVETNRIKDQTKIKHFVEIARKGEILS